jgi:hypothetical protein
MLYNRHVRRMLPPVLARGLKRVLSRPRFWWQSRRARRGFSQYGDRYPIQTIFIAGLPKSGTSWLERMLSTWPGFEPVMPPEANAFEMRSGGSHAFDLPADTFKKLQNKLAILKIHVPASPQNVQLLADTKLPYVVTIRDLRDVAVSHVFYVRRTPWHPEHPTYRRLTVTDGLHHFAETLLPIYRDWIVDWSQRRDPQNSILLRYEDLLTDCRAELQRVTELLRLPADTATLNDIVQKHQFSRVNRNAPAGADGGGFYRKGVAGDWQNYFDQALCERFGEVIGSVLIDFGYEVDHTWYKQPMRVDR